MPTTRKIHNLKTWPEHFQPVWDGTKNAEVRVNDRDYQAGEILHLREWDPAIEMYTGREILVECTHVLPLVEVPGIPAIVSRMAVISLHHHRMLIQNGRPMNGLAEIFAAGCELLGVPLEGK